MKMKRIVLLLLLPLFYAHLQAQTVIGRQNVDQYPIDQSGTKTYGLTWLPPSYSANPTKKYPLILFFHGTGEAGTGVAGLNTLINTGLPGVIAGGFNPSAVNLKDGQTYEFIVVSPQAASWSYNYDQIKYILPNVLSRYRVDLNRIYLTGLSAGGDGSWTVMGSGDDNFIKQFAAMATASAAGVDGVNGLDATTVNNNVARAGGVDGVPIWAVVGQNDFLFGQNVDYINRVNAYSPAPAIKAKFTDISVIGHSAWNQLYDPNWRSDINYYGTDCASAAMMPNGSNGHGRGTGKTPDSLNVYEWFLLYSKGSAPVQPAANAGSNQNITLPTNSVTLDGTGSTGAITSYAWTKVSGGAATITSPSAATTTVTGLAAGTYVFKLSINGGASTANVTVLVNPEAPSPPTANAGTDQTVTLPTSTVTLDGTGSTGAITSYAWTEASGAVATINSPSAATTTVTGLAAGTYVFQLSLNGGASASNVTVVVNGATGGPGGGGGYPPCGSGKKYIITPNVDTGFWAQNTPSDASVLKYQPGDTIAFTPTHSMGNYWTYFMMDDFKGNPACPLVITNSGGQVNFRGGMTISNSSYVKLTGSGVSGLQYGFFLTGQDPGRRSQGPFAVTITDRSKNVEVERVSIHNTGIGFDVKNEGGCPDSLNYPNWIIDSITIHDNRVVSIWNEGMYLGNTSPDNAANSYDPRPITCNGATVYPKPFRVGHIKVYNNYVDSTGRGGIQLAAASGGVSEIYNNVIRHPGMNGDDAQGTGISIGAYAHAYIHDNFISNTLTYGIASLGGSGTNIPIRIENNTIDSMGYLTHFNLANAWTVPSIDPATEPTYPNTFTWVQAMFIKTVPTMYTDSTIFWIKNNVIGLCKNPAQAILGYNEIPTMQKNGSIICNNFLKGTTTLAQIDFNQDPSIHIIKDCGANIPPVVNAGPDQTITLPTSTVSLTGSASGVNGATITGYTWTKISGGQATITSPAAAATTITGLVQGTYIFKLTATDNNGLTGSATVTITVNPQASNTPPVVSAGSNQTITLPVSTVTLNGSATPATGSTISSYAWTKVSGGAANITAATAASTTVTGLVQGTYVFKLTATDNNGLTGSATVTITVNPQASNTPPIVNAGSNQAITLPANAAILSGTASGTNGATISSYSWTKVSGGTANIVSPASPTTSVSGLVQGAYVFQLTATDNNGLTASAQVTVTVNPAASQPPVANAGPNQTITLPANSISITGSGTSATGTIVGYAWYQLSGPNASTILTPNQAKATFTNLVQGTYVFRLTVTDNLGATGTADVTVIVNPAVSQPPVANAGPSQTITLPVNTVTLQGSGTSASGTIVSYAWSQVSGPSSATIVSATQATTVVNNLVQGTYTFQLLVTDNQGASGAATVTVTVKHEKGKPSVNAGTNQTVTLPVTSTTLVGIATGMDGATIVSTGWTQVSGGAASINSPGSTSTAITGLTQGTNVFQLTATDNNGQTGSAQVTVTVNAATIIPPVANAGPNQTVAAPVTVVYLDGSASYDPDGSIAKYSWTQVSGAGGVSIAGSDGPKPGIYGLKPGVYTFQLVVTDDRGETASAQVTITVTGSTSTVFAKAGHDTTIAYPANIAALNGSASYSQGGRIVSYAWSQVSGPASAIISTPSSATSFVEQLVIGQYVFKLTVTDDKNNTAWDTVRVRVIDSRRTDSSVGKIYPNPVSGNQVTLTLLNSARGKVVVNIHEVGGGVTQKYIFDKQADDFMQQLTLTGLMGGVYIVRVHFADGTPPMSFKLVKQ